MLAFVRKILEDILISEFLGISRGARVFLLLGDTTVR